MAIRWSRNRIEVLSADKPWQEVLDVAYNLTFDDWVVLRRPFGQMYGGKLVPEFFYAYHPGELIQFSHVHPRAFDGSIPAISALDLHEVSSSLTVESLVEQPLINVFLRQPSQTRAVQITGDLAEPVVVAVGEISPEAITIEGFDPEFEAFREHEMATANGHGDEQDGPGLGDGGAGAGPPENGEESAAPGDEGPIATPELIDVVLSAGAPKRLQIGRTASIDVRLEVEGEARPLGTSAQATIDASEDVLVLLHTDSDHVEIVDESRKPTPPPSSGQPKSLVFEIKGISSGVAKFEVQFLQHNAIVGALLLETNVVKRTPVLEPVARSHPARNPGDTERQQLTITVNPPSVFDQSRYRYEVTSRALNWQAREFFSNPFEFGLLEFRNQVKGFYTQLEDAFSPTATDLADSLDRLDGIGVQLGRSLLDKEFAGELWKHRDEIGSIQLRSFDPYIPWELVKIWNPASRAGGVDSKFLGEYGLVRHFSGDFAPLQLGKRSWRFVIGDYKNEPGFDPVGEELDYFLKDLPGDLEAPPVAVHPQKKAIKEMFRSEDVDVIHLACHGEADLADISSANLIVSVRPRAGGTTPVRLSTSDVRTSLKLNTRQPLVFLNACETGRLGISIGQTSGWPKVLWEGGAGAVVGTHWKVRSKAARSFAIAFYESLLAGDSLAEAANKGRASARTNGDVSWMAYVVYGDPAAQMVAA